MSAFQPSAFLARLNPARQTPAQTTAETPVDTGAVMYHTTQTPDQASETPSPNREVLARIETKLDRIEPKLDRIEATSAVLTRIEAKLDRFLGTAP